MRNLIVVLTVAGAAVWAELPAQLPAQPTQRQPQFDDALSGLGAASGLDALDAVGALQAHSTTRSGSGFDDNVLPPESWALQDPADSLWRAAREALNANDLATAAGMYRRIRTESRFSGSEYRAAAFYWEAFVRHRIGTPAEMRSARDILERLKRSHPRYENMGEVDRLASRIDADLATRGDASAGQRASASAAQAAAAQCPDQEMRIAALESLIAMPTESAMPLLVQVMGRKDDCSAALREKAVFVIAQQQAPEAEQLLLDAARDPSPKVREQAVFWLSQVNTDRAVSALEEILRTSSADPKMVEHAVFALSQHSSERAARLLRDIAGRGNASVEARKAAIFWLGQRSDAEAGDYLRGLYPSLNDAQLKDAVLFAMSQRREARSADFLLEIAMNEREPLEARKQALFWAAQQRALPLSRLVELYDRMPSRELKEQIIFALSQRQEPEAVERMIEIARRERDVELRKQAVFWLGQSRDPRAVRFLTELIGG